MIPKWGIRQSIPGSSSVPCFLLAVPAAFGARLLPAHKEPALTAAPDEPPEDVRLPNGEEAEGRDSQSRNTNKTCKDAQELLNIARSFEEDLEKDDRYVLSLSSLKKLDDMEKLTKRIRGRMKRF